MITELANWFERLFGPTHKEVENFFCKETTMSDKTTCPACGMIARPKCLQGYHGTSDDLCINLAAKSIQRWQSWARDLIQREKNDAAE